MYRQSARVDGARFSGAGARETAVASPDGDDGLHVASRSGISVLRGLRKRLGALIDLIDRVGRQQRERHQRHWRPSGFENHRSGFENDRSGIVGRSAYHLRRQKRRERDTSGIGVRAGSRTTAAASAVGARAMAGGACAAGVGTRGTKPVQARTQQSIGGRSREEPRAAAAADRPAVAPGRRSAPHCRSGTVVGQPERIQRQRQIDALRQQDDGRHRAAGAEQQ